MSLGIGNLIGGAVGTFGSALARHLCVNNKERKQATKRIIINMTVIGSHINDGGN